MQLQRQLIEIIPKLHPAVVSVDRASGVLISKDGPILCQAHVSHRNGRKPGDECDVILADGTRTKARLLGADRIYDISLLKMVDPGPFPFSTANADVNLQLGEPVLKFGHPQGHKANRPAVVRLGRVLFAGKNRGVTDCLIEGGDSGGPYFDLSGNLIGIVCSSHVPDEIKANSLQLRLVLPMSYTSITVIGERIVELSAGTTTPFDMETYRQVFDAEYAKPKLIKDEEWTQGQSSLALWNTVAARVAENVVQIEWKGRRLAMGTATGAGGLVLTKASQITSSPDVRLSKDRVLSARVVGVNPAYDLALLKVDGLRCPPLTWSKQLDPASGTLLMAPSNTGVPIAAGIVSLPRRNVAGSYPDQISLAPLPDEKPAYGPVDTIVGIRRGGFPIMLECDLPMTADECGGPMLGLDGSVLGIVVARIGAYGSAVIPPDVIEELLPQLAAGKPLNSLPDRTEPERNTTGRREDNSQHTPTESDERSRP